MRFTIYVLAVIFVSAFSLAAAQKTNCHLRNFDVCSAGILSMASSGEKAIPTTDQEVNSICEILVESHGCILNYTHDCATPLQKELLKFASSTSKRFHDQYCAPDGEARKSAIKYGPCLREAYKTDEMQKAIDDVQAALELLNENIESPFDYGCCVYRRFHSAASTIVEGKCGKEAIEYGNVLTSQGPFSLLTRICSCVDENASECTSLLPPPGTKPQGKNSNNPISRLFSTAIRRN